MRRIHSGRIGAALGAAGSAKVCQNSPLRPTWALMLGQFLEFSFAARPLAAAFEFYLSLGFRSIAVGDLLSEPYVALFDGAGRDRPARTRRPESDTDVRAAAAAATTFARIRRARRWRWSTCTSPTTNSTGRLLDPSSQAVALLEARTFPPGDWNPRNVSACGEFLEYSIPTDSMSCVASVLGSARLRAGRRRRSPHAWLRLDGARAYLGLHETRFRAGLALPVAKHLDARVDYLRAKGIGVRDGGPLAERAAVCDAQRARRHGDLLARRRRLSSALDRLEPAARALTSASAPRSARMQRAVRGKCVSRYSIWSASTLRPFRVDVLGVSRRERHSDELNARFLGRAAALVIVAAPACGDDVRPCIAPAAADRRDVIARELARAEMLPAVHAEIRVALEQRAVVQRRRIAVAIALERARVAVRRDDRVHLDHAAAPDFAQ